MTDDDLDMVRVELASLGRAWTPADVAAALNSVGIVVSDENVISTVAALRRESIGAGRLEPLLATPGLTDILVNGPDQVVIDAGEGLVETDVRFGSDDEVRRLATRLAASVGRRLDEASPFVDARLADGTRLHAILATLADPGTCLSLRIPSRRTFSLAAWRDSGSIGPVVHDLLMRLVESRTAFIVSGGTGSGKTTLLASLLGLVPPDQRIVIVEDSRELNPCHPHCVRLECRTANAEGSGAVTMTDLVRQALRMRPDRLVLGEVRGAELCDMLSALNTGHEGGCATVHANSVVDVPARLEALAALGGMGHEAFHAQTAAALRVVVQVARGPRLRTVSQFGVLDRSAAGPVRVREAVTCPSPTLAVPGPAWAQLAALLGVDER